MNKNTISKIKLNGTIYDINDLSKASIESVEELTSISTNNNLLLSSAHNKIDKLLSSINGNSQSIQYGYINNNGMFQELDFSSDAPVDSGDPVDLANVGVFATGVDEADYTVKFVHLDEPDEPDETGEIPLTFKSTDYTTRTITLRTIAPYCDATPNIYYRLNGSKDWIPYKIYTTIKFRKIQFRNYNSTLNYIADDYSNNGVHFVMSGGNVSASGNVNSMINYAELTPGCFSLLFSGCTSLTTAPELPATELALSCYKGMFSNCTLLTSVPKLPATTAINCCYGDMFSGCISLTSAPELPATTLDYCCYENMFNGCTSLTSAPTILPATTLDTGCYYCMFRNCTSLTTAPELPATKLVENCYGSMFKGCTSLNRVTIKATTWKVSHNLGEEGFNTATINWLDGVSVNGTFNKPSALPEERGLNSIPAYWTVVNIDEEN